jgi:hypothetical protein
LELTSPKLSEVHESHVPADEIFQVPHLALNAGDSALSPAELPDIPSESADDGAESLAPPDYPMPEFLGWSLCRCGHNEHTPKGVE